MHRRLTLSCLMILALALPVAAHAQTFNIYTFYNEVGSGLQTEICRVSLSDDQHGGITVRISSPDTNLVRVTDDPGVPGGAFADIFVPNGGDRAEFYLQAMEDTTGTVDITVSAPGFTDESRSLDIVTPSLHLVGLGVDQDVFDIPDAFLVSVGLSNASGTGISTYQRVRVGGPGLTATITSDDVAIAELVTTPLTGGVVSLAIAPGVYSSPNTVVAGGVALDGLAPGTVEISASIPGFTPTTSIPKSVTITAPVITWSSLPADVGSGLQVNNRYVRLSGSQHGGVNVHLAVGDSSKVLMAPNSSTQGTGTLDFFIPNGTTYATFSVMAIEGALGDVPITATAPGFADGFTSVSAVQPFFRLTGLATSLDTLDPIDNFYVSVGLPNASFTGITAYQAARTGGPGLTATVHSSDGAVGQLETIAAQGDTVQVDIVEGSYNSPTSFGTGGVALNGLSVGVAQVSASIPGFAPVTTATVDVTVTQPSLSMSSFHATVGAGLVTTQNFVSLGASQHGGVIIHVESADTTLALLSSHQDSVGVSSLDLFVPDGTSSVKFWSHGLEDVVGDVMIQATSPLFVPAERSLAVVRPAVKLNGVPGSIDTIDPEDPFYVTIGYPNGSFTNISAQEVRPGSAGFDIDITHNNPMVVQFITQTLTADAVTVNIPAGENHSGYTVATGGVALDGLISGTVLVNAASPRVDQITVSTRSVTVTAPTISSSLTTKVGSGLQVKGGGNLSASNHPGVTVTITSADSTLMLVAADPLDLGQASVDVFVPTGSARADFWVQAVDGTTGMAYFEIYAPQFVSVQDSIEVVQPGVEIASLGSTIDLSDPPDQFYARVGVPSSDNGSVQSGWRQDRRGGMPPLEVTLVSSDPAVAELEGLTYTGDTLMVRIETGESDSPPTIAADGSGLVGLSVGQTIVTASIPGFIQTGAAQKAVDVSNQNIYLNGLTTRLGAGLQSEAVSAELGESSHGGVTVKVASPDSSLVLVSTNALTAGAGSVDIYLPNGQTEAVFYLQALEGAAGNTVTVVATAPTFADRTREVDIVAPGTAITLLADSMDVNVDDDEFVVQIGAVSEDGTGLFETQPIRGGGSPRVLTVYSDMASVGLIETLVTSDDTATVTIDPGEFQTAATVAEGGLAFNPVLGGEVVVTATIQDFVTTNAGMLTITLTGEVVGVDDVIPTVTMLNQNYPNPFNPRTTISFSVARPGPVTLKIYDVAGRLVRTFHAGESLSTGGHEAVWEGRDDRGGAVAAGVYLYRLETPDFQDVRRMTLLK